MFEKDDFRYLVALFRRVFNDLNEQYFEIKKARKEIFSHDIAEHCCPLDFDLDGDGCNVQADWEHQEVNEPLS